MAWKRIIARKRAAVSPLLSAACGLVKEVASKTSDVAGDGTTTATVLARSIFTEGMKMVAAGHDPMSLKRGIDKAVAKASEELKALSKSTKGREEIAQVGTVSANGNKAIGDIIAEAMDKVGKEGVITVEEAKSLGIRSSRWWKACSSTAAISPRTLSLTRSVWRRLERPQKWR